MKMTPVITRRMVSPRLSWRAEAVERIDMGLFAECCSILCDNTYTNAPSRFLVPWPGRGLKPLSNGIQEVDERLELRLAQMMKAAHVLLAHRVLDLIQQPEPLGGNPRRHLPPVLGIARA